MILIFNYNIYEILFNIWLVQSLLYFECVVFLQLKLLACFNKLYNCLTSSHLNLTIIQQFEAFGQYETITQHIETSQLQM